MRKKLLLTLLCLVFGAFLVVYHDPEVLEPFRSSFLAMSFAIATFYVSFAIGGFNSSAYHTFYGGLSPRLVGGCTMLILASLLPLAVLVAVPIFYIRTCLVLLPVLAVAGVGLLEIARSDTDPLTLLDRLCSVHRGSRHLQRLASQVDARIDETEALHLASLRDKPTHEFHWHLPIPTQHKDPLNHLATLGLLAIKRGDHYALQSVVIRAIEILDLTKELEIGVTKMSSYTIRGKLYSQVYDTLERMILALQQNKESASLSRVAIDALAEFAVSKTKARSQTQDIVFSALRLMEVLALHTYECGSQSEIRTVLIVSRQLVQKGLDDPPPEPQGDEYPIETSEFHDALPQLSNVIQRAGSFAVRKKDSALLYLCFDAFGWLGCSAVKREHIDVMMACVRALAQLGRETKSEGLECHWDKCPVRPEDHAAERIDWIATWVSRVPEAQRSHWVGLLEAAYSRLNGKETQITFHADENEKIRIEKNVSGKNHVESYSMHAAARSVDYSDFTFLKDLELYGGKGIIAQGPIVPLVAESHQSDEGEDGEEHNA